MLKVVVLQKTSLAMTEEVVLEELQVFKVPFAALHTREGGVGVGSCWGHMWGWRLRAVTALLGTGRSQGCEGRGQLGAVFTFPKNIPGAPPKLWWL